MDGYTRGIVHTDSPTNDYYFYICDRCGAMIARCAEHNKVCPQNPALNGGVWVSYDYNMAPVNVRTHVDELTARRFGAEQGYRYVIFLRFGEDVMDALDRETRENKA